MSARLSRAAGAALFAWCVTPFVSAGCGTSRRRLRLPTCLGGFGAVRLRLRRRVAPVDARARCSGSAHVGCAARRFSFAGLHGALRRVQSLLFIVSLQRGARASRRSRAALGVLGATVAGQGAAARCGASAARRRGAPDGGGQRGGKKAVPRWTHARAAGACFDCSPAREACAGACCAVHGSARAQRARTGRGRAGSEQSCKPTSASAAVQLLHDGLRERRGASNARVGGLLCRVRCAVTPSSGCAHADATRPVAAPLRQPRRAQPRRRHGHELTCTRRCTSGARARTAAAARRPRAAGRVERGGPSMVISAGTLLCRRHSWSLQPVHYCVDDTVPHLPASRHCVGDMVPSAHHATGAVSATRCRHCVGDTGHTNAVPRHRLAGGDSPLVAPRI